MSKMWWINAWTFRSHWRGVKETVCGHSGDFGWPIQAIYHRVVQWAQQATTCLLTRTVHHIMIITFAFCLHARRKLLFDNALLILAGAATQGVTSTIQISVCLLLCWELSPFYVSSFHLPLDHPLRMFSLFVHFGLHVHSHAPLSPQYATLALQSTSVSILEFWPIL